VSIIIRVIGRKMYGRRNDCGLVSVDGVKAEELLHFISDLSGPRILNDLVLVLLNMVD
jgi:hypothetical protein